MRYTDSDEIQWNKTQGEGDGEEPGFLSDECLRGLHLLVLPVSKACSHVAPQAFCVRCASVTMGHPHIHSPDQTAGNTPP